MLKKIEKLLLKYDILEIETAFVQLFVEFNNIKSSKNKLLRNILSHKENNLIKLKREIKINFTKLDLYDLINIFELLIPTEDKKLNGAFFTPSVITKFITNNTIKSQNEKICDPSCGCGAFLIEATKYINSKYQRSVIDIIENNLYGIDIANYSTNRAKILLTLLALQNNEDKININFNIYNANSLKSNWSEIFPNIMKQNGFDVIIGNPPYVKFQDLDAKIRKDLYKDWKTLKRGSYNLYFAFFELGINILSEKGILAYITPNNYFTSLAGIDLRNYLESGRLINRIVDFNHLKVFNAQTYTCITFLKKEKQRQFLYERIDDYENLKTLDKIKYSTINYSNLNSKKWRLLKNTEQNNIYNIENLYYKLGNIVDIKVGIATCKDSVYFIDGNTHKAGFYNKSYNGENYLIESEITRPIAKISDFKNQAELASNARRIIFPYKKNNGKIEILPENELKTNYPECYKYLVTAKKELESRDKGNIKYPKWYSYARTQGLNFNGEKLFTPTFSAKPRFLKEKNIESMFCNGYAIFLKKEADLFSINQKLNLSVLAKILNSKVMDYYIKRTSVSIEGGYPCFQKNFIELFGIPDFTNEEIIFLQNEIDKNIIDNFLINKYQVKI